MVLGICNQLTQTSTSTVKATAVILIVITAIPRVASADDSPLSEAASACMISPPIPTKPTTVPGFHAERLYLHSKHPGLCLNTEDQSCKANGYVVTGDKVTASENCQGWTYVRFDGPKTTATGWVASRRLNPLSDSDPLSTAESSTSPPKLTSKYPACIEARQLLTASLLKEAPSPSLLPTATVPTKQPNKLPKDVSGDEDGTSKYEQVEPVTAVQIQGQSLKVISGTGYGTCYWTQLELWNNNLTERVPIPGSNADAELGDGYSTEDIVKLSGKPYFAHIDRQQNTSLASFDKNLHTTPMCKIIRVSAQQSTIKSAADPTLCAAIVAGKIVASAVDDIEPYDLTSESFHIDRKDPETHQDAIDYLGYRTLRVVGRGHFDIDNDGQQDEVGIVSFEKGNESAGCGHDAQTDIPIKLNPDGTPVSNSPFNLAMVQKASAGSDSRLFSFRDKTYMEVHPRETADGPPINIVYELSPQGPKQMCEIIPVQYEVVDDPQ